jgi:iduronate 2-sulfatase
MGSNRLLFYVGIGLALLLPACTATDTRLPTAYNVLFITIDDLRPQLGCYGDTLVQSPNIDALANRGILFKRAYCQQALCGPSRSSFLTGYRPESMALYDIETHFREKVPGVVTLPQLFRQNAYATMGLYKVYHAVGFDPQIFGNLNDTASWSVPHWLPSRSAWGPEGENIYRQSLQACKAKGPLGYGNLPRSLAYEAPDVADSLLSDGETALQAIRLLRRHRDNPFFMAVGFYKPHLPFVAPEKYWNLYSREKLVLPSNQYPPGNAPAFALTDSKELRSYTNIPGEGDFSDTLKKDLLHGYLASISYIDAQVGLILDELERLKLKDKTIVVLLGDHGFQVGEHGMWAKKHTNYEISTRTPLIISVPGNRYKPAVTNALVELVDIYPTLAELCGLPVPPHVEGASMEKLLQHPDMPWKQAAFSVYPRNIPEVGNCLGKAIRTDRYRLVEWAVPEKNFVTYELYDHTTDPMENVNVAGEPHYREVVKELASQLKTSQTTKP